MLTPLSLERRLRFVRTEPIGCPPAAKRSLIRHIRSFSREIYVVPFSPLSRRSDPCSRNRVKRARSDSDG